MTDQTPSQPSEPSIPDHETLARAQLHDATHVLNAHGGASTNQVIATAQVHALLALNQTLQSIDQTLANGFSVLDTRLKSISAELGGMEVSVSKIEDHLDEIQRKIRENIEHIGR